MAIAQQAQATAEEAKTAAEARSKVATAVEQEGERQGLDISEEQAKMIAGVFIAELEARGAFPQDPPPAEAQEGTTPPPSGESAQPPPPPSPQPPAAAHQQDGGGAEPPEGGPPPPEPAPRRPSLAERFRGVR
jgi:hypothetical protein